MNIFIIGVFIVSVIGIIFMFLFFRSEHNGKLSNISSYSQSKDDYISNLINYLEFGWCSKRNDKEHIVIISLFLAVFIFLGFTFGSAGFMAIPIILILSIEFFILKRYYTKKVIAEIEEIKEQ